MDRTGELAPFKTGLRADKILELLRYKEGWLASAQAIRLVVPIGLNHLRSTGPGDIYADEIRQAMTLEQTNDEELLRERAATFWLGLLFVEACAEMRLTELSDSFRGRSICERSLWMAILN